MISITKKLMTQNDCYKSGRTINPRGIMVHSTATPGVMALEWFERWNKSYSAGEINRQVCVTAFVDDKEIYQYLPWNHRAWHAGGKANDTHIGFEICEPLDMVFYYQNTIKAGEYAHPHAVTGVQKQLIAMDFDPGPIDGKYGPKTCDAVKKYQRSKNLIDDGIIGRLTWARLAAEKNSVCLYNPALKKDYFDKVWENAVDLTIYLCKMYGLEESAVIDHSEGHRLGIASNHSDTGHWFKLHGVSMDNFRAEVKQGLRVEAIDWRASYESEAQKRKFLEAKVIELNNELNYANIQLEKIRNIVL